MLNLPIVVQDLLVLMLATAGGWVVVRRLRHAEGRSEGLCPSCGRSRPRL